MSGTKRRHLILAPHHDDAEFGMGGLLQQMVRADDAVRVVVAASGDYEKTWSGVQVLGHKREEESCAALSSLGVEDLVFARWFDENQGPTADYGRMVAQIEAQIAEFIATHVYVCLPSFNQDHRTLHEATLTAFRPAKQTASLLAYEYPGNAWAYPSPVFGRRYHQITPQELSRKVKALGMHNTQQFSTLGGVDPDAARKLAILRGAEMGCACAEVLFILKEVARV